MINFKQFILEGMEYSNALKRANDASATAWKASDNTKKYPSVSSHQTALTAHAKAAKVHQSAEQLKDSTSASADVDMVKKHLEQSKVHQNYLNN